MALALLTASLCPGQSPSVSGVLTNRDVITLAKAGFDEQFVIAIIQSSRRRFDTSADALADLAGNGVSQNVVEGMLAFSRPDITGGLPAPPNGTVMDPQYLSSPATPPRSKGYMVGTSPAAMAVSGNVPYYEWKTVLWGVWRKKVGVGGVSHPDAPIGRVTGGSAPYTPAYNSAYMQTGVYAAPRYLVPNQFMYRPQLTPVLTHHIVR